MSFTVAFRKNDESPTPTPDPSPLPQYIIVDRVRHEEVGISPVFTEQDLLTPDEVGDINYYGKPGYSGLSDASTGEFMNVFKYGNYWVIDSDPDSGDRTLRALSRSKYKIFNIINFIWYLLSYNKYCCIWSWTW